MNEREIIFALTVELNKMIETYAQSIGLDPDECVNGVFKPAREILAVVKTHFGQVLN